MSAVGLLDRCLHNKAKAVIQTGAAGQLGRMMIQLFKEQNIPLINVVRRQEQVDFLKKEHGAQYVLNSSDWNFDKELYKLSTELGCNVALECVAGDMTARIT